MGGSRSTDHDGREPHDIERPPPGITRVMPNGLVFEGRRLPCKQMGRVRLPTGPPRRATVSSRPSARLVSVHGSIWFRALRSGRRDWRFESSCTDRAAPREPLTPTWPNLVEAAVSETVCREGSNPSVGTRPPIAKSTPSAPRYGGAPTERDADAIRHRGGIGIHASLRCWAPS